MEAIPFYGTVHVLIFLHLILFLTGKVPKMTIHTFTAALFSHISSAVLLESKQTLLLDHCSASPQTWKLPTRCTAQADNATQIQPAAANEQKLAFPHTNY